MANANPYLRASDDVLSQLCQGALSFTMIVGLLQMASLRGVPGQILWSHSCHCHYGAVCPWRRRGAGSVAAWSLSYNCSQVGRISGRAVSQPRIRARNFSATTAETNFRNPEADHQFICHAGPSSRGEDGRAKWFVIAVWNPILGRRRCTGNFSGSTEHRKSATCET